MTFQQPRSPLTAESIRMFGKGNPRAREDGDIGAFVPVSDMQDKARGVNFIPGSVTFDRRAGKRVVLHTECSRNCWYWEREDGSRIYHFDRLTYEQIGVANDPTWKRVGRKVAGPCPTCGNPHTRGGLVSKEELSKQQ